jgi:hypothetical protein
MNTTSATLRITDTSPGGGVAVDSMIDDVRVFNQSLSSGGNLVYGPVTNAANGHLYYLLGEDTWENSQAAAIVLGGDLVTINDETEQDWVFSTFASYGGTNRSLWIGLREVGMEGNYQWVSGEPVTYTHWGSGEPNNGCGQESYVQMIKANNGHGATPGVWNDNASPTLPCFTVYDPVHGVVEVDLTPRLSIQVAVVEISWNSISNGVYQVQYASEVTTNMWTDLGAPSPSTGTRMSIFEPAQLQPRRFYRVLLLP